MESRTAVGNKWIPSEQGKEKETRLDLYLWPVGPATAIQR